MKMRIWLALVALAGALVGASPATEADAATLPCALRDLMVANLARVYGEHLVAAGLSRAGLAIEVFASADGATFTVLRTWPSGVSCVVDHGENWRRVNPNPEDQPGGQDT